jgi:hypothetical protein
MIRTYMTTHEANHQLQHATSQSCTASSCNTRKQKRISCQVGSIISLIDLFVLLPPLLLYVLLWSTKRLQQQIVAIVFGRESPARGYCFILYMGLIKFISEVLAAAWEAEMKFINGFPISTHLSGPISYVLTSSLYSCLLLYLFLLIPQGERVYSIY